MVAMEAIIVKFPANMVGNVKFTLRLAVQVKRLKERFLPPQELFPTEVRLYLFLADCVAGQTDLHHCK